MIPWFLELHDAWQSTGNFSGRVVANFPLQFVTAGLDVQRGGDEEGD